jgi:hypothetical protein
VVPEATGQYETEQLPPERRGRMGKKSVLTLNHKVRKRTNLESKARTSERVQVQVWYCLVPKSGSNNVEDANCQSGSHTNELVTRYHPEPSYSTVGIEGRMISEVTVERSSRIAAKSVQKFLHSAVSSVPHTEG